MVNYKENNWSLVLALSLIHCVPFFSVSFGSLLVKERDKLSLGFHLLCQEEREHQIRKNKPNIGRKEMTFSMD